MEIAIKILLTLSLAYSAYKHGYYTGRNEELKHWLDFVDKITKKLIGGGVE